MATRPSLAVFSALLKSLGQYISQSSQTSRFTAKNDPLKLTVEEYNPGTSDFRPLLLRLKARGVDALILNTQSERGLLDLVKQLDQLG